MCFARCESIQVEAMKNRKCFYVYPLVVEPTRLKNRSQIGSFPNPGARGENKYVCHHHLDVQHISKLDRKPKQVEQFLEHVLFETIKYWFLLFAYDISSLLLVFSFFFFFFLLLLLLLLLSLSLLLLSNAPRSND